MKKKANPDVPDYGVLCKMIGKDEYFAEAAYAVFRTQKTSVGTLQRELGMGFSRACELMDQLEDAGVVGPAEGIKPRDILMTKEVFEQYVLTQAGEGTRDELPEEIVSSNPKGFVASILDQLNILD